MANYSEQPSHINKNECDFKLHCNNTIMYNFYATVDTTDENPIINAEFAVCHNYYDQIKQFDQRIDGGKTIVNLDFWFSNESTPLINTSAPYNQRYIYITLKKPYNITLHFTGKDVPMVLPVTIHAKNKTFLCMAHGMLIA